MPVIAFADTLVGRISDSVTQAYLQGASFGVDLNPTDGTPDFQAQSDAFGYYYFLDIPVDKAFTLTVSRGGYQSQTLNEPALVTEERRVRSVALVPNAGGVKLFDVKAVVRSTLGVALDNVPVKISRYTTADGSGHAPGESTAYGQTRPSGGLWFATRMVPH